MAKPKRPPSIPAAAQSLIGRELDGRYRVDAQLGVGGMGAVYRATHLKLGRPVAIKVLLEQFGSQAAFLTRFEREAKALASLGHPHIVSITDYGVCDEMPYLVMELLEGETLAARIKRAPFPPAQVLELATQMLRALSFVHERGLVHRDLKPGNVFMQRLPGGAEQLKLLDFGLAKYAHGDPAWVEHSLTNAGEIVGTPSYISPEQIAGEPTDARTDVYSMGVMLFEMLSGRLPFEGRPAEQLKMHLAAPVPPLAHMCPDHQVSEELEALLQRAMAKQRDLRFSDAAEMLTAIEHLPEPWLWVSDEPKSGISKAGAMHSPIPIEIERRNEGERASLRATWRGRRSLVVSIGVGSCIAAAMAFFVARDALFAKVHGTAAAAAHSLRNNPQPVAAEQEPAAEATEPAAVRNLPSHEITFEPPAVVAPSDDPQAASALPADPAQPDPEDEVTAREVARADDTAEAPQAEPAAEEPSGEQPSEPPAAAEEADDQRSEPAPKPAASAEPRPAPKRTRARDPWAAGTPRELRGLRAPLAAGAPGNDRIVAQLRAYNRSNADDARGRLLLAKLYMNRNWRSDAFSQYQSAYRSDPNARAASGMLSDLIELAARGPVVTEAGRLIREAYGLEAADALDRAIGAHKKDAEGSARLQKLRARLR